MKSPKKNGNITPQKVILINKFGNPIKPYKPKTPYSARNPYSNRRQWEEIQRNNQILKDKGKWNEQSATIYRWIGYVVFILIVIIGFMCNGIKGVR